MSVEPSVGAAASDASDQAAPELESTGRTINLLAYVHLRNIHRSTGAGRTARQLTEHLALRPDVNLRILSDPRDAEHILPEVGEPWTSFRHHSFADETSKQQARWFLLNRPKAETYWPEAEVVFCTAESYVPVKKARLAVTVHDAGYFETTAHRPELAYWKTRLKWKALYAKLASKADLFHTVSEFSAERIAHFFPQIASRIRAVHNGVSPHFLGPVSAAGLRYVEEQELAGRPFILIPNGLHFRKNADLILDALPELTKRFPNLVIASISHNDPVYLDRVQAFTPNYRLLGFVDDEQLHALYAAATVTWFPSRYEGFGLPIVESMACGTPVVGSNGSSIPEIAGGAALLADPASASAHVDAIASLLTDERAQQQFIAAGQARARQFTWASAAGKLKRHFDALL